MMSQRRFSALLDAYGADPRRWPEEQRTRAEALLRVSELARTHLAAAQSLDNALQNAGRANDAHLWGPGEQEAALVRVRALVGSSISNPSPPLARISVLPRFLSFARFTGFNLWSGGLGLAAGSCLAVAIGLLAGSTYIAVPAPRNVLAILQPALLQVATD
jgi:hypothetical protein